MKPPRVYHRAELRVGREAILDAGSSRHLTRVLRMRAGDPLALFDGSGGEYRGVIHAPERDRVRVHIESFDPIEREAPLGVGLAQVISAADLMDWTVQKAVELGARWIQPLAAERAKVRLDHERAERRVAHWQRVAVAACEQCGRNTIPPVAPVLELRAWLARGIPCLHRIVLDPQASARLSQAGPLSGETVLLVGAESGLSDEELTLARAQGFAAVSLGPRVLRTETAGLAALAALQALWGDS
jgi:16S rRNA (uracil1498-N3)-methyltransferase